DGYRIAGRTVVVTATTRIDGPIAVGVLVEVKGVLQPDGTVLALRIHVEDEDEREIEFKGVVEAVLPDGYRIAGRTVVVTATTRIDGPIAVGVLVEVKGVLQPDGTVLAYRIKVEDEDKGKGGSKVEFKGVVEEVLANGYRIAGRTVVVNGATQIEGSIGVGSDVEVKGYLQSDGTVLAYRIEVEDRSGDERKRGDDSKVGSGDRSGSGDEGKKGDRDRNEDDDHEDHHDDGDEHHEDDD
ncbi:MAG TPA: DUF5666 domain-containing protein, partial [Thermoflexus sp.]|nr:DUF5666 domain-containing protein [Thermoflexus sp.]